MKEVVHVDLERGVQHPQLGQDAGQVAQIVRGLGLEVTKLVGKAGGRNVVTTRASSLPLPRSSAPAASTSATSVRVQGAADLRIRVSPAVRRHIPCPRGDYVLVCQEIEPGCVEKAFRRGGGRRN